jgi:predicted esterase
MHQSYIIFVKKNKKFVNIKNMENHFKAYKTFRYYSQGDMTMAHKLFVVLHGYGQLAKFFIRKFQDLNDDYFVLAPEGMHRFYLNGSSGRVGASWMTKESRETDIDDNLSWLSTLIHDIQNQGNFKEVILLGFSQGGATAARLVFSKLVKVDHFISWACVFPPDINFESEIGFLQGQSIRFSFVLGTEDIYFTPDQQKETLNFYAEKGFETYTFVGGHQIESTVLEEVISLVDN